MYRDPIVEEIRKIRQAHAAKFGFDIRKIVADPKQREGKDGRTVIPAPPRPTKAKAKGSPKSKARKRS
jgi:hypothetical protein